MGDPCHQLAQAGDCRTKPIRRRYRSGEFQFFQLRVWVLRVANVEALFWINLRARR